MVHQAGSENLTNGAVASRGSSGTNSIVASWGRGEDGQLGLGDADERLVPTAVCALTGAGTTAVYCGAEYTVAVCQDVGQVYSWGW